MKAVRWGGSGYDGASSLAIDSRGSIWVTGSTESFGAVKRDVFLARFSPEGNLTKALRWGGPGSDYGYTLAVDLQGAVWVAGQLDRFQSDKRNYFLVKTDSFMDIEGLFLGIIQAEITALPGPLPNQTYPISELSVVADSKKTVDLLSLPMNLSTIAPKIRVLSFYQRVPELNQLQIVKGITVEHDLISSSFSNRYQPYDLYLQQADGSGLPNWLRYNGITGVLSVVWPVNFNVDRLSLAVGHKQALTNLQFDLVVKGSYCAKQPLVNEFGQSIDINALDYSSDGALWSVASVTGFGAANSDVFLARFSPEGHLTKALRWGGSGNDYAKSLAIDSQGAIWITGDTYNFGAAGRDVFLAQFSPEGNLTKAIRWGGADSDYAYALAIDSQSAIWIAGNTYSFGAAGRDVFLAQFSPVGDLIKAFHLGSSNSDSANALAIGSQGSLWVTGETNSFSVTKSRLGFFLNDVFLMQLSPAGVLTKAVYWGALALNMATHWRLIRKGQYGLLVLRIALVRLNQIYFLPSFLL